MSESQFFETAYRIINKYNAASKHPRRYGRDQILLYSAETHMIEIIGSAGQITTTGIAESMAVTKGAVSQTTSKLLKKGLIQKDVIPEDPRGFYVSLTVSGQEVFQEHRLFHNQMVQKVEKIYSSLPLESKDKLKEMLDIIDHMLDQWK